jgi:hypothetical protein
MSMMALDLSGFRGVAGGHGLISKKGILES